MKILGCLLILLTFVYIGKELSNSYYKKLNYYKDFKNFLEYAKLNIDYNNIDIINLLKSYTHESSSLKKDFDFFIENKNFQLYKNEKLIGDFFNDLGKKSKRETLIFFDNYIEECKKQIEYLRVQEKQKGVLPLKLSIALGVVICIVFL